MSIYGYLCNILHSDSKKDRGFEMPSFLSKRTISEYDAPELQELFIQNEINFFGDLTDEMLRSFLKYSYPKAIYVIELLGLYGVKFLSEKTKHYSEPCSNDYRLLKFERKPTEILISYNAKFETETVALKRYLLDMRLTTLFLLDGIKIDVLLNHLNISEDVFKEIFSYEIYPEDTLYEIYPIFKKRTSHDILTDKELEEAHSVLFSEDAIEQDISQEIPSYIADIKLPRPEFSVRLSNALSNNNITCIKDLLHISKNELLKIPNFGQKSLKELEEYLKTENVFLDVPYVLIEKDDPHGKSGEKFDLLFRRIQNFESKLDDEDRKKDVYEARIKNRDKITLQKIADDYSVTRERIRQLEVKILKDLEKIILDYMNSFTSIFEKYGSLISYKDVEEFKLLKYYDVVLKNVFEYKEEFPFFIDLTLGFLILKDFEFEEILFDGGNSACISYPEIEDEIRQRISLSLKQDTPEAVDNLNRVLQKIVEYNIENNFVFDAKRNAYLSKTSSLDTERIELAFKELYPSGTYIFQNVDEIYEKLKLHDPMIECSTKRAIEARLVNNEKIILTNRGFYQHIDTIKVDPNVISFASEECKKKLQKEGSPFQISIIFEENKAFFERNGVFSEYLLFSLLKRFDDPSLLLRRLLVYNKSEEVLKISDRFEEYFKSHKGIIPIEEVKNHFNSLGWDSFRLANQISSSSNIFKISTGYFHKDNFLCNREKLSILMDKVQTGINECGYVSLDDIRKKNFVDWIEVFNHEDLDARSMSTIIRAYYPECPYDVNSKGLISYGSKLKPYEILYQWITQKCETEEFVTATDIMDFCEEKNFHRYNTKKQIKDKLAEVADECFVSYDYLGIDNKDAQNVVEHIKKIFEKTTSPYMSMQDLLEIAELPVFVHGSWNEYIVRSIIDNVGGLVFYGFIVINPYQERITRRDHVVANEIVNFTKTWFMETKRLESLLRRNKVFNKNETFSHKSIQNELFGENSCIEIRDQEKNVCIKSEHREHFE